MEDKNSQKYNLSAISYPMLRSCALQKHPRRGINSQCCRKYISCIHGNKIVLW